MKYTSFYKKHKSVFSNVSYLAILQIFNLLFPFITYPYLLRIVGVEKYGVVIFASSIITYISLLLNFGFNTIGARDIAYYINDKNKVSEIVSTIYINKFIFWVVLLLMYFLVISILPLDKDVYLIYLFSFFLTFNEWLFPVWYFQAIEKMRYITFLNIGVRLLFVFAVFVFIKSPQDYIWIPFLNATGALLGGLAASLIVFGIEKIQFSLQPAKCLAIYTKDAFPVFISSLSVQIYLYVNKIVVGTFLGMSEVTIYDLGEKIANLLRTPIGIISQATFPRISREKSIAYINKVMYVNTAIVFVLYGIICLMAKWVVILLTGHEIVEAEWIIRILSISAIFASLNVYLGGNRMIPFGYSVLYSKVSVAGCLFYLVYLFGIWFFDSITYLSISLNLVLIEVFVLTLLICYDKKLKILHE